MRVRFRADADLHQMIVTALLRRKPSMDFQTATAAGLAGLCDRRVLVRAATEGRPVALPTVHLSRPERRQPYQRQTFAP